MRIAMPLDEGKLAVHFGHCTSFALIDVDEENRKIIKREDVTAPPHQPGLLPPWLAEREVQLIIAGGMGQRAKNLFDQHSIRVLVGASEEYPENLVRDFLDGVLHVGENICDH